MKYKLLSMLFALSAAMATQAGAATRIMQGNTLLGGTDVLVDGTLYDVDLRSRVVTNEPYPGPASPFATQAQAEMALQAIFTQLIGDGTGATQGQLIATDGNVGSPEHKTFGIVQTFGNMIGPNLAMGVSAQFDTTLSMPTVFGAPWPASATMTLAAPALTLIPTGTSADVSFPTWTLASASAPVPEPSTFMLSATGLLVALLGARFHRRV